MREVEADRVVGTCKKMGLTAGVVVEYETQRVVKGRVVLVVKVARWKKGIQVALVRCDVGHARSAEVRRLLRGVFPRPLERWQAVVLVVAPRVAQPLGPVLVVRHPLARHCL